MNDTVLALVLCSFVAIGGYPAALFILTFFALWSLYNAYNGKL